MIGTTVKIYRNNTFLSAHFTTDGGMGEGKNGGQEYSWELRSYHALIPI